MIVYGCADLLFATRIRSTAESLGVQAAPARDSAMLAKRLAPPAGDPGEPATCVMLDLDLGERALAMIEQIKAHNRAIPVIAFGSHVAVELLQAARERGADAVMPRSQFTAQLPELIRRLGGATA